MASLYIIEKYDDRPELKDNWQPIQLKRSQLGFYFSMDEAVFWAERSVHDELGDNWRVVEYTRPA